MSTRDHLAMLEVRQRVTQPTEGRLIYRPLQPVLASSIGQHPSPPAQRLLSPRSPFALPAPRGIAACGQFGPSRWVAAIGLGSLARARGASTSPFPRLSALFRQGRLSISEPCERSSGAVPRAQYYKGGSLGAGVER